VLAARALGEGARRTEIGDPERLLERETGRHDLAEDLLHRVVRQGAGIDLVQPAQHLGLALGALDVAMLDLADALRALGAFAETGEDFLVEVVDAVTQVKQFVAHARSSFQSGGVSCVPRPGARVQALRAAKSRMKSTS